MEEGSVHCHWTNRILVSTVLFYHQGASSAKKLHQDKTQKKFFISGHGRFRHYDVIISGISGDLKLLYLISWMTEPNMTKI